MHNSVERSRSYSGGWNVSARPKPPRIATVKPVSKSFSEDDLMKASEDKPRVCSRLKVYDLASLKKDNIISELEKCLAELEEKHDVTQQLSDVYQKVETERNELLDELDIAFQDLQEYMQRQKVIEDQNEEMTTDREELQKENEYLKAVLSNRNEIQATQAEELNKTLHNRVGELERKNTQLVDEINNLYEDRQTLISSLLNLRSEDVDEVIKKRSRSSSVTSRESLEDRDKLDVSSLEKKLDSLEEYQDLKRSHENLQAEHKTLLQFVETLKGEIDAEENEKDQVRKDSIEKTKEYNKLLQDRNEKNLGISKLNLEKRTLQRQLDHMRESNRTHSNKVALLTGENEKFKSRMEELQNIINDNEKIMEARIHEAISEYEEELTIKENENEALQQSKQNIEAELEKLNNNAVLSNNDQIEMENLRTKVNSLENTIVELKDVIEQHEVKCDHLLEENVKLNKKTEVMARDNEKHLDDIYEVKNERERFKRDIFDLKTEKEKLDQQILRLKSQKCDVENNLNNRVKSLESELSDIVIAKDATEKLLRKREESEKKWRETCEKLKKTLLEQNEEKTHVDRTDLVNCQRELETAKKENEHLLRKCEQLEKNVSEADKLSSELKRVKDSNETLLQRYRTLKTEKESEDKVDQRTSEREKYSALLVKYDNLCKKYDTLCNQHKLLSENYDVNVKESKNLTEQIKLLDSTLKECGQNFDKVSRESKEQKEKSEATKKMNNDIKHNQARTELDNLRNENKSLQNRLGSLRQDMQILKAEHEKVEKDYQYILKSHKEEAQAELATKQNRVEQERDAIKMKYDLLRFDFDKYDKEKIHYKKTIDSLREENTKLHVQIQKHKLISNSTQDLMIKRLRTDNETLENQIESLQNSLNASNLENKSLLQRINRTDENTATIIRSLKARKNELQLQNETLKHDNQQLKITAKVGDVTRTASNPNISKLQSNTMATALTGNLRSAQTKITELESENCEYSRKFQESEALLYDLQQALAKANDLAMQKAVEGSKTRRTLEKKVDKLYEENVELRRKVYFSENKPDDVTPNSLFPNSPILSKKNDVGKLMSRKASLPVKMKSRSIDTDFPSKVLAANIFTYQDSLLSFDTDNSRTTPLSPRLIASKQMENDLSQQLRELLELTNDLTSFEGNADTVEAPPVPPPPANYEPKENEQTEMTDGGKENESDEPPQDIDELLESLTKVAEDLEKENGNGKNFEHWV